MSIGEVPAAARRQAGLTTTQVSQRTCIRETIIRGSKRTTSPLAAATSLRAGTSAPSLVPRAWTASRWSGSTTPATARHSPAPLPTCPGRPLPPAQAAPQAGLGRRAAGRARGLPGRCQCPNPAKATSRRRCCVHRHHRTIPGERDRLSVMRGHDPRESALENRAIGRLRAVDLAARPRSVTCWRTGKRGVSRRSHLGSVHRPAARGCAASGMALAADASGNDPDVFRLGSLLALGDVELDLLSFLQAAVAAPVIALKCTNTSGPPSTAMKP